MGSPSHNRNPNYTRLRYAEVKNGVGSIRFDDADAAKKALEVKDIEVQKTPSALREPFT